MNMVHTIRAMKPESKHKLANSILLSSAWYLRLKHFGSHLSHILYELDILIFHRSEILDVTICDNQEVQFEVFFSVFKTSNEIILVEYSISCCYYVTE